MLRSTFSFGVTNIPVCSNGVYVYTPSVQRLLQLSANIYDASNTNFFPSVFRPLFGNDTSNNVFIIGYQQVTDVSGPTDPQLSPPYSVPQAANWPNNWPLSDSNGPVNVYGVPWIIGVKKGFPAFNQFALVNAATITRKLQVLRTTTEPVTAVYNTNQMYIMSVSNEVAVSFWNSYISNYPDPVTVFASDTVGVSLSTGANVWSGFTNFTFSAVVNSWPGSQWTGSPLNATPKPASFLAADWSFNFLSPSVYRFGTRSFDPVGSPTSSNFETMVPPLPELPQFSLNVTNYLQAFILDGNNVIDYVQLCGPNSSGGVNQALADPNYPEPNNVYYQWSTNAVPYAPPTPYGVLNQLWVSGHPTSAPGTGGQWSIAATPMGVNSPSAEAAYFNGFFVPTFQWQGMTYVNSLLYMQAPYTPTRTVYSLYLLQANDPLVHYLASDLNARNGALALWNNATVLKNGDWYNSDSANQPLPVAPITPLGGRYQPWGQNKLMTVNVSVTTNAFDLALRDPLVWWADSWSFPTNLLPTLVGLGQVHRGTPWQTFYLKSPNILDETMIFGLQQAQNVGTNTWALWTGDLDANDAALMAPTQDWHLAGVLMSLLNTNNPAQLTSVNGADWTNILNGLTVYSNSIAVPLPGETPQFDSYIIAGSSPQTLTIANAVVQAKSNESGGYFYSIGDILAVPDLSVNSGWLNTNSVNQLYSPVKYGITDSAYEAIPAQLLPLLRLDSIGEMTLANGQIQVKFSGYDGQAYAVQVSSDLVNWTSVNTNSPVNGTFQFNISSTGSLIPLFYRSLLLP